MSNISRVKVCSDGTILEQMKCKVCGTLYWTNKPKDDLSRNYCVEHKSHAEQEEKTGILSRLFRRNETETPKIYEISNKPCDRCGGLITWDVRIDGNKPTHINEDGHIQGDGRCPRYSTTSHHMQSKNQKGPRPKFGINKAKLVKYRWFIIGFAALITIIDLVVIFIIYPIDGPFLDLYSAMFFQATFKYVIGIVGIIVGLIILFFSILKIITEKEKEEKRKYIKYLTLAIMLIIIGLYFATTPINSFNVNPEFVSFYYAEISYIP